ncbi:hypothetical protein [Idiomarina sp. HP20-50]|uniref:hypothetical protein n=1 Tax=Idiomarina sp. HP20-50 TaxID=3070813 RepID=UPI00294ACD82|nr:hypothetical protein [Idiomarina sp. HP20-50]MDV6315350.1 hypothetical protein [Idiomarina sp. HP20-50]
MNPEIFFRLQRPKGTLSVSGCGRYWWWQQQRWQFFNKALVVRSIVVLLPLTRQTENGREKRHWLWVWWFQLPLAQQLKLRRQLQQTSGA